MKYVRRNEEVIEADVWTGTDARHQYVESYNPPNGKPHDTHLKCKKRWVDHGYVEPVHVHGKRAWDDIELVCPGDYLIEKPSQGGVPQFTVVTGALFERTYQEHEDEVKQPIVFTDMSWAMLNRIQQNEVIEGSHGAGVLIIPKELLDSHGSPRT